jgi:long-chain acyl-CoA synthetase
MAAGWCDALGPPLGASAPAAMVMSNDPRSVALFFALSSRPAPLILLPPDLRPWRSEPPLPAATRLVLLETERDLEPDARALGVQVITLGEPGRPRLSSPRPSFMTMPGVVLFTSGSTNRPRPVYRSTSAALAMAHAVTTALGLSRGSGVIATLPLSRAFGLNQGLIAAAVLGGSLALLERFDHNALLHLFASGEYRYWAGTPMMADVLGRCRVAGSHGAPPVCLIGGRVPADVGRRFNARFGVPLRWYYGSTETGSVSVDTSAAALVRSDATGRPLPGVGVRIGDPETPYPAGVPGRVWVSSPRYLMQGYGFPPDLAAPETVNGWWATPDAGSLDESGVLVIAGRLDDCFRTDAGHLVNPGAVSAALERYPGVTDSVVVPIPTAAGLVLGVLVQSEAPVSPDGLRGHLRRSVPAWSQPHVVETTTALPRLASGRIDRRACIGILERSLGGR